jgi:ferredoxin
MRLDGKRLLICDCEGTMPLDGKALAKACGQSGKEGADLATHLCRSQVDRFHKALAANEPLVVACTQEAPLFDELRAEAKSAVAVSYVNIRETAGWSSEAEAATPKIAALLAAATVQNPVMPTITLKSNGVTLIYGRDESAIQIARQLASRLDITVMLDRPKDVPGQPRMDIPVVQGRVRAARGYLGAFELVIDDYALPLPSSRDVMRFGAPRQGAASRCDIIIDLSGGTPLFPAHEKRDGYFRPDPNDPAAVQRALFEAVDLVGEFEKPLYVDYHAELCAHSRSKKTGCNRCLDVCPTGAIVSAGDKVAFDPHICAGCGSCGAVCPTGAADYRLPPAATLAEKLRSLLLGYSAAEGKEAVLLVHDAKHGAPLIDALARFGEGLPARVLPFEVYSVTELGIDFFASAFAYGASAVQVLAAPKRNDLLPLAQSIGLAEAMLGGLGYSGGRLGLIDTADPDQLLAALRALQPAAAPQAASYLPMGSKRDIAKLGLRHLHKAAPAPVDQVALPAGAPFGNVVVDAAGCTLCLSCVSACPTGALIDDPSHPRLSFTEDACVQCGLCKATCPEKVITLEPRFNFLNAAASPRLVKEEEPFHCIRCAKPFGIKSSVERIAEKLGGKHWMFAENKMIDRIRMCADCRVIVQSENAIDPYAGAPRPMVRTTEDYFAERAAKEKDGKLS